MNAQFPAVVSGIGSCIIGAGVITWGVLQDQFLLSVAVALFAVWVAVYSLATLKSLQEREGASE